MQISLVKSVSAPLLTVKLVQCVARMVCAQVRCPRDLSISVVAVGDTLMCRYNSSYRSERKVTDVLSFQYDHANGEVVVCYPQAQRQALAKNNPLRRELAWLLTHGILHIVGYDHETAADAKIMRPLEQTIVNYV